VKARALEVLFAVYTSSPPGVATETAAMRREKVPKKRLERRRKSVRSETPPGLRNTASASTATCGKTRAQASGLENKLPTNGFHLQRTFF